MYSSRSVHQLTPVSMPRGSWSRPSRFAAGGHQHVGEAVDHHARKVEMVVRHLSESFSPPTPWISIRSKAPVIASKPVA